MRELYRDRRDVLVRGLRQAGWDVPPPEGRCSFGRRSRRSSATWAPSASRSCCWRRRRVAVAPGIGFGEHGDGQVASRWSRTTTASARRCAASSGFLQGDNVAPRSRGLAK
jgi:alanine-synthesizing transaminase